MKMSSQRGRPGTGKNFPHMFSVTLNDVLNDKLLKYCHLEDVDKTQVVRFALTRFFSEEAKKK
jgi:hypothetical protein